MQIPGASTDREIKAPKAGEIWYVDVGPQVSREQPGLRPALLDSADRFNDVRNDLFIVCPLTIRDAPCGIM